MASLTSNCLPSLCVRSSSVANPRFSSKTLIKTRVLWPQRLSNLHYRHHVITAAFAADSKNNGHDNPYQVLGVSPIESFDMIKAAYTRKHKDAIRRGDEALSAQLERAYDEIMMAQLKSRKKGLSQGSFQVSKDIKYADQQPIVPWAPRFAKSGQQDMQINLGISVLFTAWVAIQQNAEYKPLEFLAFAFVYRIFEKLKALEPTSSPTLNEEGDDDGRMLRMGKRLLRSLALVFGCIALSSLAYTGALNLIELIGRYIPRFLYNSQELLITASSAICLFVMASYYK